jgi:hypothetical protein
MMSTFRGSLFHGLGHAAEPQSGGHRRVIKADHGRRRARRGGRNCSDAPGERVTAQTTAVAPRSSSSRAPRHLPRPVSDADR